MPYRLQIALVFLAPVLVLVTVCALLLTFGGGLLSNAQGYLIRLELPEPGMMVGLPQISGPDDLTRPLLVIDPGHGGHDPGAKGAGVEEKALTLALARALRDELLGAGGIRVALTRDDDRFLVLEERSEIARKIGADLFLSIHADSAGEQDEVNGASVYTLSARASSQGAARFAARENSADVVNGVALAGHDEGVNAILLELSQRRTQERSNEFAALIVREGQGRLTFHPQPRRSAALVVLRAPDVPSALFEAGFVSNPEDAGRLASPEGRQRFAESLSRAIRVYFAREREG